MSTIDDLLLPRAADSAAGEVGEKKDEKKKVPPPSQYVQSLLKSLVLATKASNAIPSIDNDYDYHVSSNPLFKTRADACAKRSVTLIDKVVRKLGKSLNLARVDNLTEPDSFEAVTDLLDGLLEQADTFIDIATGNDSHKQVMLMKGQLQPAPWTARTERTSIAATANDIPKPQLNFSKKVDNSRSPFVPHLSSKPNAITPLKLEPVEEEREGDEGRTLTGYYPHPYEAELSRLDYPEWLVRPAEGTPTLPPPVTKLTPCTWIDTEEGLKSLIETLKKEKIIAIDLENHSYRSFLGFVCLMQISTRSADYLVDTLALRGKLGKLNIVFTDPKILKVLHGADHDILWLQRDFGLYIVNMFDTGQAARVLDYPGFSLAYLLRMHCKHVADKKYQLADWRIRPLTAEMKKYAQEDTHYLLYIFDVMKKELLERSKAHNFLLEVLRRSKEICLQRYEKPVVTPEAYLGAIETMNLSLSPQQRTVFAALFDWRDRVGRELDESVGYVLPKHVLIKLSTEMPSTLSALNRCINPLPPLLRERASDIIELIARAVAEAGKEERSSGQTASPSRSSSTATELVTPKHRQQDSDLQFSSMDATPSPITSYANLYTVSGWTPNTIRRQAALLSPVNDNYNASQPLSGVDFSGNGLDNDSTTEKSQKKAEEIRGHIAALPVHLASSKDISWQERPEGANEKQMAPTAAQGQDNSKTDTPEEESSIPQSIAEIYQMSNINRKRKKEKKKLKESAAEPTAQDQDDTQDDEYAIASKKQKNDLEDAGSFMNKLGWVSQEEAKKVSGAATDPAAPKEKERERAKFKPFDYSAAASATTGFSLLPSALKGQRKQGQDSGGESLSSHVAAAYGVKREEDKSKVMKAVRRKGGSKSSRPDWAARK